MEGLDVVGGSGGGGAEEDEEVRGGLDDDEGAEERGPREEVDKELVVVEADAVAHPRAVVVHLEAAAPALAAVVAARRLHARALGAPRERRLRCREAAVLGAVLLARSRRAVRGVGTRGLLVVARVRVGAVVDRDDAQVVREREHKAHAVQHAAEHGPQHRPPRPQQDVLARRHSSSARAGAGARRHAAERRGQDDAVLRAARPEQQQRRHQRLEHRPDTPPRRPPRRQHRQPHRSVTQPRHDCCRCSCC